ncbi:hypothetical protein AMECASPLE_032175 [Ameca splendens]|uniref:Uncharacterized protein n=1 Tax=Ameca splendens TaxID=208324 RepID=A0ABV0YI86_9TELE
MLEIPDFPNTHAFVLSPQNQFVEPPFTEVAAAGGLEYFSTSFPHLDGEFFVQPSLQNHSSSVRLDGKHLWHTFSVRFGSGLGLDHFIVALAVCLGLLYRMEGKPPSQSQFFNRFSSRIALHSSFYQLWSVSLSLLKKSMSIA